MSPITSVPLTTNSIATLLASAVFILSTSLGKRKEVYYAAGVVAGLLAGAFLLYRFVPSDLKSAWLVLAAALQGKLGSALLYNGAWPFSTDLVVAYAVASGVVGASAAHLALGDVDVATHRIGDVVGWILACVSGSFLVLTPRDPAHRLAVFSVLATSYLVTLFRNTFATNAPQTLRALNAPPAWDDPPAPVLANREFISTEEYQRLGNEHTKRALTLLVQDPRFQTWVRDNHDRIYVGQHPDSTEKPIWRHLVTLALFTAATAVFYALTQRTQIPNVPGVPESRAPGAGQSQSPRA